jgi:beta-glucosidase
MVFGPVVEGPSDAVEASSDAALLPGRRDREVDLRAHMPATVTVLEGIRAAVSAHTELRFAPGCHWRDPARSGFDAAVAAARGADAAVVVLGGRSGLLPHCTSGEAVDRARLGLPGAQQALLEAVAATGTPLVVVIVDGRPLALAEVSARAGALLLAWLPGEEGGAAVADVLFGRAEPGGRLPVTLPREVGQVPLYYNHKPSGARSQFHGDYRDLPCTPLFPFGHGLGYARFAWDALELSSREPDAAGRLEIALRVTNTSPRAGEEVVQLYLHDRVASVTRPVQELAGFARVALAPGASRRVRFELDLRRLAFHDLDMQTVVEPGEVEIRLGASSADLRLHETIRTTGSRRRVALAGVRPTAVRVD